MKMKRYVSSDMRSALRAIREEQGPDAVILSTRATPQGVEVCAAIDLELAAAPGSLAETAALKRLEYAAVEELQRADARPVATSPAPPAVSTPAAPLSVGTGGSTLATDPSDEVELSWGEASADGSVIQSEPGNALGQELKSLRRLLEQQLAALAWNDFTRREPLKARALADLARLGLDRDLSLKILADVPAGASPEQMQRMPYALLARRILTCAPPAERQGALALIGPPGSGKTTTLAKLAARYVLEQDPANLLIISTDDERLGSHAQLASLGRLLGVRVETVLGIEALAKRVRALPDRCILIDTPGVGARDAAAAAQYRALIEQCATLTALLVLPASAQGGVIEETVANFGAPLARCCALTRLDEAVSLGGVLSALARSGLPVAYACEGARIPEDLRPARAHQLVARAVELARSAQTCADDDLLARRYGGSLNAA